MALSLEATISLRNNIDMRLEAFERLKAFISDYLKKPAATPNVPDHLSQHFALNLPAHERVQELGALCACAIDTAVGRWARTQLALRVQNSELKVIVNKSSAVASLDRLARDKKLHLWEKAWIETAYEARRAIRLVAEQKAIELEFRRDDIYSMPIPDRSLISALILDARKVAVALKSSRPECDRAEEEIYRAYRLLTQKPVMKGSPDFLRSALYCYTRILPKEIFRGLLSHSTQQRLAKRYHDEPLVNLPQVRRPKTSSSAAEQEVKLVYQLETIFPLPT